MMTKKNIIVLFIQFVVLFAVNGQSPAKYWVEFKDKNGSPYSVAEPERFLSPRAVELRKAHGIAVDETDLPVSPAYIGQILAADTTARCFTTSKWLNGATIYSERENFMVEVSRLPFVKHVERTIAMKEPEPPAEPAYIFPARQEEVKYSYQSDILQEGDFDYGKADAQVRVNNAHWLHRMGFRGEGMRLMVLDGGFQNIDTISCFRVLCDDNRLLGARNIVQPDKDPMRRHTHGTMVLSCIASYIPGVLVGTAPMVQVNVCQTEDSRSENRIEEDNWVAGLEYADSLGCQVLNSSLGYTTFDDTVNQRRYEDLDGKTSRASLAARIAASKGLIICNSAGNEGGKKWKHIGAPADAMDILTVGAVNTKRGRAFFSSFGPTADGRTKPDACAVGRNTVVSTPAGIITVANGTSFSSPMLAGMVTCLWQAFPDKSAYEIMEAVRQAGNRHPVAVQGLHGLNLPFDDDNGLGFGITNFLKAYNILRFNNNDTHIILLGDSRSYTAEKRVDFLVNGSIREKNYRTLQISITPINPDDPTAAKPRSVKVKCEVVKNSPVTAEGSPLLLHSFSLPALPKNKKFQIYRIDFLTDGFSSSMIVGQERNDKKH